jgi:phage terminase large subunit
VKQAIRSVPWLDDYLILAKSTSAPNRHVSYVFCGLRHNLDSINPTRILVAG